MVQTALAVYPEAKTPLMRMWVRGYGSLYGSMAWYTRAPPLTAVDVDAALQRGPEWFRMRLDIMWQSFARDADMTGVLVCDCYWVTPSELEVQYIFLKNDLEGADGTRKRVQPRDPEMVRRYMSGREPGSQMFPESYDMFLTELKKWAGPQFSTRSVRRGAATEVTDRGAEPSEVQLLLAHKVITQQRTYVGKLTEAEVAVQRRLGALLARRTATVTEHTVTLVASGAAMSLTSTPNRAARTTTKPRARGKAVTAAADEVSRLALAAATVVSHSSDEDLS